MLYIHKANLVNMLQVLIEQQDVKQDTKVTLIYVFVIDILLMMFIFQTIIFTFPFLHLTHIPPEQTHNVNK